VSESVYHAQLWGIHNALWPPKSLQRLSETAVRQLRLDDVCLRRLIWATYGSGRVGSFRMWVRSAEKKLGPITISGLSVIVPESKPNCSEGNVAEDGAHLKK